MPDHPSSSAHLDFGQDNTFSQSQIITGDIAGRDIIHHHYPADTQPRPVMPSPVADFCGRQAERAALAAALRAGRAVIICGMGGLGKTQLALQLAADVQDVFPDGQLLIELAGGSQAPRTPDAALRSALWALCGSSTQLSEDRPSLETLYRATLAGRRLLVVVDDAPDSASVRSFVPPAPCALLVTSRARITLEPPMQVVDLDLLTDTESETLLLQLAPRLGADTRTADLLAHCANLPLALRVVGNTLRERPDLSTDRYLARLADETRRLGALRHDDRDVYAILGVSDTLLAEHDPMLAERWRMLHVCPAPFDRAVVAALWAEEDEDALDDGLGELLRRSLLSYDGASGRYRLHDVLRDVARQRCDAAALAIANERHSQYFSWLLDRAGRLYRQGGQDVLQGLVLFDANLSHILVGQAWAVIKEGADQLILDYALIFPEALVLRLHPHIRIRWLEAAKAAAQRCGDIRSEGIVLGNLGMAYADLGEVTMAISLYQQQLVIAQNLGNRHSESIALTNLGIAYKDLGEVRRAIGIHEQRIWIARSLGDKLGEGRALSNLGIAYHELGELRSAISCYEHHLEIARAIEDFSGEAIALGNLGVAYRDFGDVERALSYFKPVLALSRRMGNRQSESKVLCNLGNIYSDLGKMDQAITFYEQCLELTQVIGDRQIEGIVLGNLGIVYNTLGEVDRAIAYYEQHLQLVQLIEDRPGEVLTCWNLGRALASQGNYVRAAELMQRYVEYLHELGHPDSEAFEDHLEDVRRKIE